MDIFNTFTTKKTQQFHILIWGKKLNSNEMLMIPIYNPNIGEYLINKITQENYYEHIKVFNSTYNLLFEKKPQ